MRHLSTACGLLAAVLIGCASGPAAAQSYNSFTLGAGFTPDPQTGNGETGGQTQATRFGPQCSGVIDSTPDHTIRVTSPLDLRLSVESTTDSTLVVVGPAGVFCDDDSAGPTRGPSRLAHSTRSPRTAGRPARRRATTGGCRRRGRRPSSPAC